MKNLKKILYAFAALIAVMAAFGFLPIASASVAIGPGLISLGDLENQARRDLSSFEGGHSVGGYYGQNDDLLDFAGYGSNFLNLPLEDRIYTMTLTNANAATRVALLSPGYLYSPNTTMSGVPLTGAFNDANGAAGLSASGTPTAIEEFYAYIMSAPTQVARIKITSTVATQIAQQITVQPMSPFNVLESRNLTPGGFSDQYVFQDKVVVFEVHNLIFSKTNKIIYPIVGSSTCTISFYCGASLNTSKTLESRIGEARNTVAGALASGSVIPSTAMPTRIKAANERSGR